MSAGCGVHRAGDGSYLLFDTLNNIPCKRACDLCRSRVDPSGKLRCEGWWERNVAAARARAMSLNLWYIED